jgi:hypothetical protein
MWLFAPEGNNQNGITDRSRQVTTVFPSPHLPSRSHSARPWCGNFRIYPVKAACSIPRNAMLARGDLAGGYLLHAPPITKPMFWLSLSSTKPPSSSRQGLPPFIPRDLRWHRFHISRLMFGKSSASCVTIVTWHQLISQIHLLVSLSSSARS